MAARLATSAVGLPLLVLVVWAGFPWFSALAAAAAAIGAFELSQMARRWGDNPITPIAVLGAVALVVAGQIQPDPASTATPTLQAILAASLAALSLLWLLSRASSRTKGSVLAATLAPGLFIGGVLFHAPLLRELSQGREWVIYMLLVTFATDTGAFLVGRAIGKRKLAPAISPSKTQEGAAGGLIAAVGTSLLAAAIFDLRIGLAATIALGALVGVAGQLGDLAESRIKRIAGVKDSGRLFPGHGGILDRMDSIVFNLVVVYYFVA